MPSLGSSTGPERSFDSRHISHTVAGARSRGRGPRGDGRHRAHRRGCWMRRCGRPPLGRFVPGLGEPLGPSARGPPRGDRRRRASSVTRHADRLVLELTESVLMEEKSSLLRVLDELRSLGLVRSRTTTSAPGSRRSPTSIGCCSMCQDRPDRAPGPDGSPPRWHPARGRPAPERLSAPQRGGSFRKRPWRKSASLGLRISSTVSAWMASSAPRIGSDGSDDARSSR